MEKNVKTVQIAALNDAVTFIVDEMLKNDFIFPDGEITGKDFEQVYLYAVTLFDFHDYINGRKLGESITLESFYLMFDMLKNNFSYSADQITALQSNITEEMRKYALAYNELITKKVTEDALRKYVSDVLQHFPSVESSSSFSFAGAAFATLVTANAKYVSETYDTLVSIPETFEKTAKENTSANDNFVIEDYTTQNKTSPEKPKKKNTALIVCAIALICSLIGNVYLYSQNVEITHEAELWSDMLDETQDDRRELLEWKYKAEAELDFYDRYAVIVSEYNNKYHKYDCELWDYPIWIYNIDAAKGHGYTPCSRCFSD